MPNNSPNKLKEHGQLPIPAAEARFDQASFEIFFKENYASLCAYCQYKFDFDPEIANEAVHSAFVKLWDNRHTITRNPSKKAYLISIVNNNCIDVLRHNAVKRKHAEHCLGLAPASTNNESDKIDEKNISRDVQNAIAELPLQMRRVFQLSRFEGLRNQEIATRMHLSVKTVETQMSRALARLRKKLARYSSYFLLAIMLQ